VPTYSVPSAVFSSYSLCWRSMFTRPGNRVTKLRIEVADRNSVIVIATL